MERVDAILDKPLGQPNRLSHTDRGESAIVRVLLLLVILPVTDQDQRAIARSLILARDDARCGVVIGTPFASELRPRLRFDLLSAPSHRFLRVRLRSRIGILRCQLRDLRGHRVGPQQRRGEERGASHVALLARERA